MGGVSYRLPVENNIVQHGSGIGHIFYMLLFVSFRLLILFFPPFSILIFCFCIHHIHMAAICLGVTLRAEL